MKFKKGVHFFTVFCADLHVECRNLFSIADFSTFASLRAPKFDIIAFLCFFSIFFLLYASFSVRLAQGDFLYYYNYGFDFDPARFVASIAGNPELYDELFIKGGPKHPLIYLLRPFAWPFEAMGFDARTSASLVKSVFGAGTVGLVYVFFRFVRLPILESASLTILFGVSGTQLFTAFIVETYGFALFFIVFVWCMTLPRMTCPLRFPLIRLAVAVLNIGVTTSNGIHSVFSEVLVWCQRIGLIGAISRTLAFLMVVGIIFMVLVVIVWNDRLLGPVADPIGALKFLYWMNPKGPKAGLDHVLLNFFGYSFVSPNFSVIRLPEGVDMYDFRTFYTSGLGILTFYSWAALLAAGVGLGLWQREMRPLTISLIGVISFTIIFHLSYQYRGSLYLYAAHAHFPIFATLAGVGVFIRHKASCWRLFFVCYVLLLTVLMGTVNLSKAIQFVTLFDHLDPPTHRILLEN